MDERKMGTVQTQFAELVWKHEPIGSGELVKLCEREWGWKKPTTYTVLRKLCERGIFQNENSVVTARITREEYYAAQGERLVGDAFNGSLPAFVAAFTARKALSAEEVAALREMIDAYGKES